jgi:F-type H+-transporting ATPase subunit a
LQRFLKRLLNRKKFGDQMRKIYLTLLWVLGLTISMMAQDHSEGTQHEGEATHSETSAGHADHGDAAHGDDHGGCGDSHGGEFNPGATAFHHISDQNIFNIGPFHLPLPVIVYVPGSGFEFFSSSKFHADAHGTGEYAYNGFVLYEGVIRRVVDEGFPGGHVELGHHKLYHKREVGADEVEREVVYVCYNNEVFKTDNKSTADGGLFGGGITSFYDFSITKNVASMLLVVILLSWMFLSIAKAYKKRDGKAPKGMQSFIEVIFVFIQDEVAKPFLGHKWEKFLPFLQTLFFFILGLNLFGQIPFLGGSNVTGNLAVTAVLAIITFFVVNLNGNKHYWGHTLWMPGVPALLKAVIITPVEILGLFIKPLTLALRLFANITAGHMVMVIFVGLIFVFGKSGEYPGIAIGTGIGSTLLTLFMMSIELLVAFIQAFVFTILTASYIGAATEEAHH